MRWTETQTVRIAAVTRAEMSEAAKMLGKRSYRVRLRRFGIERLREIARENGKKGGRPPKKKLGKED
ncbi:MAG TPA: hypothetical protein VGL03_04370 [Thermoanaerobaculia bacterium]|jgi:hypothetical protein